MHLCDGFQVVFWIFKYLSHIQYFSVLLIKHIVLVIIFICSASRWIKDIILDNDCNICHTFLTDNDKQMFSMYSICCIIAHQMYNKNTVCFHTQWSCGGKLVRVMWNMALKEFKLRKSHRVFFSLFSQGESVKYFLDNLEKLGQSVSPTYTAETSPITNSQQTADGCERTLPVSWKEKWNCCLPVPSQVSTLVCSSVHS